MANGINTEAGDWELGLVGKRMQKTVRMTNYQTLGGIERVETLTQKLSHVILSRLGLHVHTAQSRGLSTHFSKKAVARRVELAQFMIGERRTTKESFLLPSQKGWRGPMFLVPFLLL